MIIPVGAAPGSYLSNQVAEQIGGSSVSDDQEFLTEGDGVIGSPLRQVGQRPLAGAADLR